MPKPRDYIEIVLQPGEFYLGDAATRLRTLLGSCVALTMWHPQRRLGAMSHFMLPSRATEARDCLDGRYGEESILMFLAAAKKHDTDPKDYQIKLFGGGNMFPHVDVSKGLQVGARNVARARERLAKSGLTMVAEHSGETGHRIVMLDNWSGRVWLKHAPITLNSAPPGINKAAA